MRTSLGAWTPYMHSPSVLDPSAMELTITRQLLPILYR